MLKAEKVRQQIKTPMLKTYLRLPYTKENEVLLNESVFTMPLLESKSPFIPLSKASLNHIVGGTKTTPQTYTLELHSKNKNVPVYLSADQETITIKHVSGNLTQFKEELLEVCKPLLSQPNFANYMKINVKAGHIVIEKKKKGKQDRYPMNETPFWCDRIKQLLQQEILVKNDGFAELATQDFNNEGFLKQIGATILADWKKKALKKAYLKEKKSKMLQKLKTSPSVVSSHTLVPQSLVEDLREEANKKGL